MADRAFGLAPSALFVLVLAFPCVASAEDAPSPPSRQAASAAVEPSSGAELTHEPYISSSLVYYGSERRVIAGLGGGVGYRLQIGEHWGVHVEGRYVAYVGSAGTGNVGAIYRIRYGTWEPFAGLQVAGYVGEAVKVVSSAAPDIPPDFAWAVQARLALARFVDEGFSASLLSLELGAGADGRSVGTALSVSLLELGARF